MYYVLTFKTAKSSQMLTQTCEAGAILSPAATPLWKLAQLVMLGGTSIFPLFRSTVVFLGGARPLQNKKNKNICTKIPRLCKDGCIIHGPNVICTYHSQSISEGILCKLNIKTLILPVRLSFGRGKGSVGTGW